MLTYSSNNSNSWCGKGWDLNLGCISIKGNRGGIPRYTSSDKLVFEVSGNSMELVKVQEYTDYWTYRAKIEGMFWVFKRYVDGSKKWLAIDPSGTQYFFGESINSRIDGKIWSMYVTYKWYLSKVVDVSGNYYKITYFVDPYASIGCRYPQYIDYTYDYDNKNNNCRVEFELTERTYVDFTAMGVSEQSDYSYPWYYALRYLLTKIKIYANNIRQKEYTLHYTRSTGSPCDLLTELKEWDRNGSLGGNCMPPNIFEYTKDDLMQFQTIENNNLFQQPPLGYYNPLYTRPEKGNDIQVGDFNGDGISDFVCLAFDNDEYTYTTTSAWGGIVRTYNVYTASCTLQVHLGDGMGNFSPMPQMTSEYCDTSQFTSWNIQPDMYVCNINEDNKSDIVLRVWDNEFDYNGYKKIKPMIGNGDGTFQECTTLPAYSFYCPVIVTDINSDNIADILERNMANLCNWDVNIGHGDGTFITAASQSTSCPSRMLVDLNNDGLVDNFYYDGGWNQYLNLGDGYSYSFEWDALSCFMEGNTNAMIMGDFNGDGRLDIGGNVNSSWIIKCGLGYLFQPTPGYMNRYQDTANNLGNFGGGNSKKMKTGDFNGDGVTDLAAWDAAANGGNGGWDIRIRSQSADAKGDLLHKVFSSTGGSIKVTYAVQKASAAVPLPITFVKQVVVDDRTFVADGGVHQLINNYSYADAAYDFLQREFRGFGRCEVLTTVGSVVNKTKTWFRQEKEFQGKAYKTEVWDGGQCFLSQSKFGWQSKMIESAIYPYLARVDNLITYSKGSTQQAFKRVATEYEYDDYGNTIKIANLGVVDYVTGNNISGDEVYKISKYSYNTDLWIVNKPYETTVCRDIDGTQIISGQRFRYDGSTLEGDEWQGAPTKGLVKRIEYYDDQVDDPAQRWDNIIDHCSYDNFGNAITTTDALGRVTVFNRDPSGIFITSIVNVKGHRDSTEYYGVNNVNQDKGLFGQVKRKVDINNSIPVTVSYIYDGFGRLLKTWGDDDSETSPSKKYDYISFGYPTAQYYYEETKVNNNTKRWTRTHFDGLGRTLQVQVGANVSGVEQPVIMTTYLYDATGNNWKTTLPFNGTVADYYMPAS
ncbi:MAG: SpvB/TcaC N-terminal domain-containing protein, partial [Candidatus Zixiibacteriota bacterium]